jgi:hydrogenase maturation protease
MTACVRPRVMVAGIGNIFLEDDGFGVEVIKELEGGDLPEWVQIADYGISGMHLAYDLLGGYDTTILVDATPRGEAPGTLYLIEAETGEDYPAGPAVDAHGMQPDAVFRLLRLLGGDAGRVVVVGCEPASLEHRIGLSPKVRDSVAGAVKLVTDLAWGATPQVSAKRIAAKNAKSEV